MLRAAFSITIDNKCRGGKNGASTWGFLGVFIVKMMCELALAKLTGLRQPEVMEEEF